MAYGEAGFKHVTQEFCKVVIQDRYIGPTLGPNGSFGPVVARTSGFESRPPGRMLVIWVVYIVLHTVQRPGVYSAVCGDVNYDESM